MKLRQPDAGWGNCIIMTEGRIEMRMEKDKVS